MKFTSHERDRDPTGFGNDVDYMHARYYLHRTGRFLSPDPILGTPDRPQSWNRYAYVMGSPTNFIDEYGLEISCKNNQGENDRVHCAEKLTVTAKAPPEDYASISLRQSIRSFLAENGGPGPCDASCQVMRGVAEIRAPVEGLETAVALVAETVSMDTGKHDLYVYTADDERLAALDILSAPWQVTWTLREDPGTF